MVQTKVEKWIIEHGFGKAMNSSAPLEERQALLDEIAPAVLRYVSPQDLLDHNQKVYNVTAKQYRDTRHNRDVIDEIIPFMDTLPDGARVLDVGCACGRDACFMAYNNHGFRWSFMGRKDKDGIPTRDKFPVPTKQFYVIGIDTSLEFLQLAQERAKYVLGTPVLFAFEDMHDIKLDDDDPGHYASYFAGVWSCTALFTHTPHVLLEPAIKSVVRVLKTGGVFFTSYTNGMIGGVYDKLLASSTGYVKYFSQPDPEEIRRIAKKHGLILLEQAFSDYKDKKALFVSQIFRKEA
ncbi:MAG: hypothetical protein G01um101429_928 [Parcubacteria group bacterium Gr01-1014_29]|nr:MAG: hypothetical protein G01um101429_928 [Parcubacteria group bacterium Gr01-1014_29]